MGRSRAPAQAAATCTFTTPPKKEGVAASIGQKYPKKLTGLLRRKCWSVSDQGDILWLVGRSAAGVQDNLSRIPGDRAPNFSNPRDMRPMTRLAEEDSSRPIACCSDCDRSSRSCKARGNLQMVVDCGEPAKRSGPASAQRSAPPQAVGVVALRLIVGPIGLIAALRGPRPRRDAATGQTQKRDARFRTSHHVANFRDNKTVWQVAI
jgi:hypothetical protein